MDIYLKSIFIPIAFLGLLILSHILTTRYCEKANKPISPIFTVVRIGIILNIPLIVIIKLILTPFDLVVLVYIVLTYNCLAYSYCHIFNMSETSRRIRIIYEIKKSGGVSMSELQNKYSEGDMAEIRIGRLKALRQIEEKEGKYFLKTPYLFWIAVVIAKWGKVLGCK